MDDAAQYPMTLRTEHGLAEPLLLSTLTILFLTIFFLTLSDYGPTWDSANGEFYIGDANLEYLLTGDREYLDLHHDNLPFNLHGIPNYFEKCDYGRARAQDIWPLGPMLASLSKRLLFSLLGVMNPIDASHAILGPLVALLLIGVFRFARDTISLSAAVITTVALATYPRFFAEVHNNIKDVPGTVFITLSLIAFYRGLSMRRERQVYLGAFAFGCALSTRPSALFIPIITAGWWLPHLLLEARQGRLRRACPRSLLIAIALTPVIAVTLFVLLWPWMWHNFPQNFVAHIDFLRFQGMHGPPGWKFQTFYIAYATMPPSVIVLFIIGFFSVAIRSLTRQTPWQLALFLLLWFLVPVLKIARPYAHHYDGIRHFLEFVPAVAVLTGVGGAQLLKLLNQILSRILVSSFSYSPRIFFANGRGAVAFSALWFSPVISWNISAHPFQIAYFNSLTGGLAHAQASGLPAATDYWGSSYRKALEWLNEHAEEGSAAVVGVAPHIPVYMRELFLRPDIALYAPQTVPELERNPWGFLENVPERPIYVLFITRREFYPDYVRELDEGSVRATLTHSFLVDGAPILKILKLELRA